MEKFKNFKEIANPKIDSNGNLISSFRLEILMQDIAHLFDADEIVGVTMMNRIFGVTVAKNDLISGSKKQEKKLVS